VLTVLYGEGYLSPPVIEPYAPVDQPSPVETPGAPQ
jgi:hypothetical protein